MPKIAKFEHNLPVNLFTLVTNYCIYIKCLLYSIEDYVLSSLRLNVTNCEAVVEMQDVLPIFDNLSSLTIEFDYAGLSFWANLSFHGKQRSNDIRSLIHQQKLNIVLWQYGNPYMQTKMVEESTLKSRRSSS